MSDNESGGRSKLASLAFTAAGLAFFFGVGLAGGAAYKIYFAEDGSAQTADQASPPPPAASATPPNPILAANDASATEKPAADSPPIEAAAPPAPVPPAASTPADATEPTMMAQAAAPPVPESAAPAASIETPAAPIEAQAAPDAPIPPVQPETQAAMQSAEPQAATATPPKPATAAPAHRPAAATKGVAPQTAAVHPPPAAHGGGAGAFRVQFGAFANEENARHLQSTLEAAGLKVVVSHDQAPSGNQLFYVRSQSYPDRAAAMSAAQNVRNRAQHSANPVRIDYTIIADHAAGEQHAQR